MGGKDLNFYVGPQAPFTNKNAFEKEKNVRKGPIVGGHREMLKDTSSRGSSSSDLRYVSQVNFALT